MVDYIIADMRRREQKGVTKIGGVVLIDEGEFEKCWKKMRGPTSKG